MVYPIAEIFHSIQGEGVWTGTPMLFVRLAGCCVGRYDPADKQPKYATCTSFNGEKFACDTDYRKKLTYTEQQIVSECWEAHVCITGGEPFIHNLKPLIEAFYAQNTRVHIETSGTMSLKMAPGEDVPGDVWITCSPKEGFYTPNVRLVDEWKFLVSHDTKLTSIETFVELIKLDGYGEIYLQPVNSLTSVDKESLQLCLQFLQQHPEWRLSVQLHKLLGLQ